MVERAVNPDYPFAQVLDSNCGICASSPQVIGNTPQLKTLQKRIDIYKPGSAIGHNPKEVAVAEALKKHCEDCYDNGRNYPNSPLTIRAMRSCVYRG